MSDFLIRADHSLIATHEASGHCSTKTIQVSFHIPDTVHICSNNVSTVHAAQAIYAAEGAMPVGGRPVTEGIGGRTDFGSGQLY